MEELLNKLIEKGWRPFDVKWISEYFFESVPVGLYRLCWKKPDYDYNVYSKRDLVSKESGLWQFVCENWIIENWKTVHDYVISHITYSYDKGCWWYAPNNSEFWIMMSALCDEDKLEKFLLENIKIS